MAQTPERKVKAKVEAALKAAKAYYFSPATHGYGRSGVPDIIACLGGRFIAFECKAGKGTTTALQERELRRIVEAGGVALVVSEENVGDVGTILRALLSPA